MTQIESSHEPLLIGEWAAQISTREGLALLVRPIAPEDEAQLREFYARLSPDDLRFRFLAPPARPNMALPESLISVDHVRTEDFLVFVEQDGARELIATAMLAADPKLERAEVAIAILPAFKGRGVGWTLLDFIARDAAGRGIKTLESIECSDNRITIALEKEMGFTATPYPGDPTLTLLTKRLDPRSSA